MVSFDVMGPYAYIDSHARLAAWGENLYPVAAGDHIVAAHCEYQARFGFASTPVRVLPGQTVTVFYAAPNPT